MATCLKCDNCPKVVTEQDDELARWWSLERYGADWVEPPGASRNGAMRQHPASMATVMFMGPDDDDDEEMDESMLDVYIEESQGGIATEVTLHFCSAVCLGQWAVQAEAFEG